MQFCLTVNKLFLSMQQALVNQSLFDIKKLTNLSVHDITKEETFAEETFASGKIREIFGRNFREFRELANFGFFARIIFREFML